MVCNRDELHKASITEHFLALRYAAVCYQKHFVTVFGADLLSETECCIATRQNKMAAPDLVNAGFKKIKIFLFLFFVLGQSGWCIHDHRTQNQSLKQAPLVFYENLPRVILAAILERAPIKRTIA